MKAQHLLGHAGHSDRRKQRFQDIVGRAIRRERDRAGVTLPELAKRTGLAENALVNAENGHSCPAYVLALVAEALDVAIDTLVPTEATSWRS